MTVWPAWRIALVLVAHPTTLVRTPSDHPSSRALERTPHAAWAPGFSVWACQLQRPLPQRSPCCRPLYPSPPCSAACFTEKELGSKGNRARMLTPSLPAGPWERHWLLQPRVPLGTEMTAPSSRRTDPDHEDAAALGGSFSHPQHAFTSYHYHISLNPNATMSAP